jgi:excisionase family DNA binding protein
MSLDEATSLPYPDPGQGTRLRERLLSPQELADYLEVPVKTIYSWRHHGKGPRGFRVGKHVRFRWGDVETWLSKLIAEEG